jgi:mono/diheme cytochrome c family protein
MRINPLTVAAAAILLGAIALTAPAGAYAQSDGAKLFKSNCVLCHGADGTGNSPTGKALKAKDLGSTEVQEQTDVALTDAISKGKGKMPAFGGKLKADDIKALLAYVRALKK